MVKTEKEYVRPDLNVYKRSFEDLLHLFKQADSIEWQNEVFLSINKFRFEYESSENLAYLRNMMDLKDEFWQEEQAFFRKANPVYQGLVSQYYKAILQSPFRRPLEKRWGTQLFKLAGLKVKVFSEDVMEDLQKENDLVGQYFDLIGKMEIEYGGNRYGMNQMGRFTLSNEREERKAASHVIFSHFEAIEGELDSIFDELIKIRTEIARKLGYDSFTKLAYDRLGRTNYSPEDVERYRDEVKKHGIPFVSGLREKQRKRMGLEKLKFYDERIHFKTGAPVPNGDADDIIAKAQKMFAGLSQETGEFFDFMISSQNLDLISRDGKRGGAFATYIGREKEPFIFANFVGVTNDVRVLAHEAGHAFQFYMSRNAQIPEYIAPTYDAAEIFSFTMERFVWPWMEEFFGGDAAKYKFGHLTEAFILMPWANAIDEFQHFLYEFPHASPAERKAKWRDIERIYMPEKDYDGVDFLERGGSFYPIVHLFETPFYFIDYDIAHNCAIQLWVRYNENFEEGWSDFLNICRVGGSESLVEIINRARLVSPFEEGSLQSVLEYVGQWVEQFDDESF